MGYVLRNDLDRRQVIAITVCKFFPPRRGSFPTLQEVFTGGNTYFLRVEGNSMEDARIHDGDVLVVDRALEPEHGSIVIAAVDNEVSDTLDLR
ncbi:hypothetical protein DM072_15670, partial [Klebsiella pneumoniae]